MTDDETLNASALPGLDLANVTTLLIEGLPPAAFPNATPAFAEVDNVTNATGVVEVDLVWTNGSSSSAPPVDLNVTWGATGSLLPPFVQLVGIGLFLLFASLVVAGLWKVVGASQEDE